jgi:divalent metal cation (Fe/Co/Zn/Cd) transporter
MVGVRIGSKQADSDHPYGHARFECVASLLLSFLVFITGLGIGWNGLKSIFSGTESLEIPGIPALVAALVVCAVKEALYWYTIRSAKKLGSLALKASAWDHRSDVFASLGVFISILILRVAVNIFLEAVSQTVDQACEPELEQKFRMAALSVAGVMRLDELRSRRFGSGVYVDMEIAVDGRLSLREAHDISERVHDAVEECEPTTRHCMVHVNPYTEEASAPGE